MNNFSCSSPYIIACCSPKGYRVLGFYEYLPEHLKPGLTSLRSLLLSSLALHPNYPLIYHNEPSSELTHAAIVSSPRTKLIVLSILAELPSLPQVCLVNFTYARTTILLTCTTSMTSGSAIFRFELTSAPSMRRGIIPMRIGLIRRATNRQLQRYSAKLTHDILDPTLAAAKMVLAYLCIRPAIPDSVAAL